MKPGAVMRASSDMSIQPDGFSRRWYACQPEARGDFAVGLRCHAQEMVPPVASRPESEGRCVLHRTHQHDVVDDRRVCWLNATQPASDELRLSPESRSPQGPTVALRPIDVGAIQLLWRGNRASPPGRVRPEQGRCRVGSQGLSPHQPWPLPSPIGSVARYSKPGSLSWAARSTRTWADDEVGGVDRAVRGNPLGAVPTPTMRPSAI